MTQILLTTINARYSHASFGLRYLYANLGALQEKTKIVEFTLGQRALDLAEQLLSHKPTIIGLGVYIWNAEESRALVAALKAIQPDLLVVLGGPEVSYEYEEQEIVRLADYLITGEADIAFRDLCERLLAGDRPSEKVIAAPLPTMEDIVLPYAYYTEEDIAHRVVYVEASRGCPFKCEFCLSSLDIPVRKPPLESFLAEMQKLLDRGVRQFKFVDRTFNLHLATSERILQFFLDRYTPGLFLHFEMIPDRLPVQLRDLIAAFPAGALQFEVGIQTFNPTVAGLISRKQRYDLLEDNFRFLNTQTGVHIHADLIIGLPGETVSSFADGFDRLVGFGSQEIQVGILKRLRGTPIARHEAAYQLRYSPFPPYEILSTRDIDFFTMQRLRRFARGWDLVVNSGNFVKSAPRLWEGGSPFWRFLQFSDWLFGKAERTHGIAHLRLTQLVFTYLYEVCGHERAAVAQLVAEDYLRGGRNDIPEFLRADVTITRGERSKVRSALARQRHLGQGG